MKRTTINFVVDAIALALLAGITFTGVIMKWVLPPGTGGRHGGTRFAREFLSLDRHQWGEIHLWLSILFLAAMVAHVLLHWRWIRAYISGRC